MNQKISELNSLTEIQGTDLLAIVDVSIPETKKVDVATFKSLADIDQPILAGPGQILQFSSTLFQNSGYVPGIGTNDTPSSFGFFPVQNANFVFNPFAVLGANKNYKIYAIKRQDGAFNDGVHCMIRQVVNGVESGVPGLLDWGSGSSSFQAKISDTLNSGVSDSFIWYRSYFASYNGGNGATIQDLTLYIVRV